MSKSEETKKESFWGKAKNWKIWEWIRNLFKEKKFQIVLYIVFVVSNLCFFSNEILKMGNFNLLSIKISVSTGFYLIVTFTILGIALFKRKKTSYVVVIISFLILIPLLTYYICSFFQNPQNILVGTVDAWIGFSGSLLGGIITLYVLWMTIEDQSRKRKEDQKLHEQERKEELAVQYRPILSFNKNNIEYTQDQYKANLSDINIKIITDSNYEKLLKPMIILIDNIGRGEAIIKKIVIKSNKNNSSIIQTHTASKGDIIVGPEKSVKLAFQFDPKLFNGLSQYEVQENLSLTLTYTDLIQKNIYKTIIDMYFLLDVNVAAPPGIILESGAPLLLNSYNETITMRKSRKR